MREVKAKKDLKFNLYGWSFVSGVMGSIFLLHTLIQEGFKKNISDYQSLGILKFSFVLLGISGILFWSGFFLNCYINHLETKSKEEKLTKNFHSDATVKLAEYDEQYGATELQSRSAELLGMTSELSEASVTEIYEANKHLIKNGN